MSSAFTWRTRRERWLSIDSIFFGSGFIERYLQSSRLAVGWPPCQVESISKQIAGLEGEGLPKITFALVTFDLAHAQAYPALGLAVFPDIECQAMPARSRRPMSEQRRAA